MIRIHPNLSRAACAATIALALGVAGCRSSSSGIAGNPFLAPDRVPPPSTRALLPGQAQPYYQGDPLPVMQSATTPPGSAVAAIQSEADARSSSGRTLAWNVPGGFAPAAVSAPPSGPIAVANEPSVAVPTDADPLRFALPTPAEPVTVAPVAVSPPPIHPPMQAPAAQPPQGVSLASYTAPAASLPPTTNVPPMVQPQPIVSPWRAPQIAQPTAPPAYSPQQPNVQPPAAPPAQLTRAARCAAFTPHDRVRTTAIRDGGQQHGRYYASCCVSTAAAGRPDAANSHSRLFCSATSHRRRLPSAHQHAVIKWASR